MSKETRPKRQKRVTVTHPRTRAARPGPPVAIARDVQEQTALGEVYLRALMRSQLRLGLTVCVTVCLLLGSLPLAFELLPRVDLWGIGLSWLILGGPVYLLLFGAGTAYVRRAERNEREFTELVSRS